MKYKTSELEGAMLDMAVVISQGGRAKIVTRYPATDGMSREVCLIVGGEGGYFEPRLRWAAHGRPIFEREGFKLWRFIGDDGRRFDAADKESFGETPLVAAMRAFVTAKLGAEVDL